MWVRFDSTRKIHTMSITKRLVPRFTVGVLCLLFSVVTSVCALPVVEPTTDVSATTEASIAPLEAQPSAELRSPEVVLPSPEFEPSRDVREVDQLPSNQTAILAPQDCISCVRKGRLCPIGCCTKQWYPCSRSVGCCDGSLCRRWKWGHRCEPPCIPDWYPCDDGYSSCCNQATCTKWRWGKRCEPPLVVICKRINATLFRCP